MDEWRDMAISAGITDNLNVKNVADPMRCRYPPAGTHELRCKQHIGYTLACLRSIVVARRCMSCSPVAVSLHFTVANQLGDDVVNCHSAIGAIEARRSATGCEAATAVGSDGAIALSGALMQHHHRATARGVPEAPPPKPPEAADAPSPPRALMEPVSVRLPPTTRKMTPPPPECAAAALPTLHPCEQD